MSSDTIRKQLLSAGMTPAGAAGMMGNMYAESGLVSNKVETLCLQRLMEHGRYFTDATYTAFVDDGTISREEFLHPLPNRQYGYGLYQATFPSIKAKLYDAARRDHVSIGDERMQIDCLVEMLKADFPSLWQILTTTSDIQTASNAVLMQFERPADTGRAVRELRYQFSLKYEVTTMITVNDILNIFRGWLGWSEANGKHRQIIDIYNAHKPLARGYKVQYTDAWCDTTVSAAFITANAVSAIGGTECGVQEHIQIFRKAGIWLGKVKPQAGDLICYDWGRDGCADHIGIVETVNGSTITTIEGNYQDAVSRRVIAYDDYRICGYARPKYSADPDEYTATEKADKFDAALAGTYITKSAANMRNGASSTKYSVMVKIPEGAKVQNYGYYSLNGSAKWLYVQVTIDGKTYTGFVSSGMLKKA